MFKELIPRLRFKPYTEKPNDLQLSQNVFPQRVFDGCRSASICEALEYSSILDLIEFDGAKKEFARAIDIGSKNFVYAPALARFLSTRFNRFELTGIEVDPGRIYTNLYRRGDYGKYFADLTCESYPNGVTRYQSGDWLSWDTEGQYDVAFCLFPFLFEDLNRAWGLKPKYFAPQEFYKKLLSSAKEVIFFHQGKLERDRSLELIQEIGLGRVELQVTLPSSKWISRKIPTQMIYWKLDY